MGKVGVGEHALRRTEHHILQHYVVGEQDVRRIALNPLLSFILFLPGVAVKTDWNARIVLRVALQRLVLAVNQRVHGINDDGANLVLLRLGAEDMIHDGD